MDTWNGCYDDGWRGLIVDEAFAHPAKMSLGLTKRIFKHAFEQGWLKKGDTVLDPFGGIGSTAIVGTYEGVGVVCIELEPRFCALSQRNFDLHRRKWEALGVPQPTILQGDSRELLKLLQGADCIVGSPPWHGAHDGAVDDKSIIPPHAGIAMTEGYGTTPGQLAAMKPGDVDAIVSSPPYEESINAHEFTHQKQVERLLKLGNTKAAAKLTQKADYQAYTGGNGNLGNLKPGDVDAIVGSPPYEGSIHSTENVLENMQRRLRAKGVGRRESGIMRQKPGALAFKEYQEAPNSLGAQSGPTFWSAAREIMQQCHAVLKPGGMAIWVVKRFVRKGALVDFPGDWLKLCESCGFTLVCRHQAMLTKETTEGHLFDGEVTKRKERKSFFRRLAERKGSPAIDWEDVLCLRRQP